MDLVINHTERRLTLMREFLEAIAADEWGSKYIRSCAAEALEHWDDPLYHGREASDPGTADIIKLEKTHHRGG
jgi:hypothetical protein